MTINTFQNAQNFCYFLGNFWRNFNNLELFLRLYLNKKNGKDNIYALELMNLPVGTECEENPITDYSSFGNLCKSFNFYQDIGKKIDFDEIIEFRDAMVHGRIGWNDESDMFVVTKYSKPKKNNKVTVEYNRKINLKEINEIADKTGKLAMEVSLRSGAKIL